MNVIQLSTPTDSPITDEALAEWVRINVGQDALSTRMLIFSATTYIEGILNRVLLPTNFRAEFDCISLCYRLPREPVIDVVSVSVDGQALARGTDWKLDPSTGIVTLTALPASAPMISFTAGFSPLPANLMHAIMLMVGHGYDSRSEISQATMTSVERLCARYRRVTL